MTAQWTRIKRWAIGSGLVLGAVAGRAGTPPSEPLSAADAATVSDCVESWLWAAGSKTQIEMLKSLRTEATVQLADLPAKLPMHAVQTAAGFFRFEIERPGGDVLTEAFDGTTAWRRSTRLGVGLIPPAGRRELLRLDNVFDSLRLEAEFKPRRLLPEAPDPEGHLCQPVEFTAPDGSEEVWFFEVSGGVLRGIGRLSPEGRVESLLLCSNYESVQNPLLPYVSRHLSLPFTVTRLDSGTRMVVTKTRVEPGPAVDAAQFAPPPELIREVGEVSVIFDRYLAACGGTAALERITSRVTRTATELQPAGVKFETTVYQKAPNLILTEARIPGTGLDREAFDGHTGWAESEIQGFRKIEGAELLRLMLSADLQDALHLPQLYPLHRLLPDQELAGRRVRVVRLATINAEAGTYYFDAENGRLVRADATVGVGPHGTLGVVADFSDFRTVDGVCLPYVAVMTNPAMRSTTVIQSIEDNVPIPDERFRPPKNE